MWVPPPQTGSDADDLALQLISPHGDQGEQSRPPRHPRRQPRNEDQSQPRRPPGNRATNQEMLQTMQEQLNATHQLCLSNAQALQTMNRHLDNHDMWFQWIYNQQQMRGGMLTPPPPPQWQYPQQQQPQDD